MQEKRIRRSNVARTDATRGALLDAARRLFVERGYAQTGTPELAAAAGVTRGALYHHFADKRALFHALAEREAAAVAAEIEAAGGSNDPLEALLAGAQAYLEAMRVPGRTRLLLIDGPAVLGPAAMDEIDRRHGGRTLREGLEAAVAADAIEPLPLEPLAVQLGAAFDKAALAVGGGADEHHAVLSSLITGLRRERRPSDETKSGAGKAPLRRGP